MRHEWKHTPDGPPLAIEEDLSFAIDGRPCWNFAIDLLGTEILNLAERVRELEEARPLTPFERIGADRLADEVASLVSRHLLDSRSAAADALLDYREPPRSPRSDRIADLEAEVEAALRGQVEISESNGRMFDKLQERERKLRAAACATLRAIESSPAYGDDLRAAAKPLRDLLKEE